MNEQKGIRKISKARLIAALMAELDASEALILAQNSQLNFATNIVMTCDFRIPFHESTINLKIDRSDLQFLDCVCCFSGNRIEFSLVRIEGPCWQLPKIVALIEQRSNARIPFFGKLYSAEIILGRSSLYGFAFDINRDYLAIDMDEDHNLLPGEDVKVIIRMVGSNCDVLYHSYQVAETKKIGNKGSRIILLSNQPCRSINKRELERTSVQSSSIQISHPSFLEANTRNMLAIENISIGGMTLFIKHPQDSYHYLPGVILKAGELDISFLIVWVDENRIGIRPLVYDPSKLSIWHQYVDCVAPPENRELSVTRQKLADILTHSGLLKAERRKPFGKDLPHHIIANDFVESPLLIQRCLISDKDGKTDLHVSYKRISESTWFLGEGANSGEKSGEYNSMMNATTKRMVKLSRQSHFFCRYLTGVWHHSVKSTVSYGEEIGRHPFSRLFDALHMSISFFKNKFDSDAIEINEIRNVSAPQRRHISLKFSSWLYEPFVYGDGSHPILSMELGKMGPYHRVVTKFVALGPEEFLIAHRIFTHNIWSSTGVTNSVFVLVPGGLDLKRLNMGLDQLSKDNISFGTDDFCLILDGQASVDGKLGAAENYQNLLAAGKRFTFLVHDLSLNEELFYKDSDYQSS